MDIRRFRNRDKSQAIAQLRWLGWVMLMMFTLLQAAKGADADRRAVKGPERGGSTELQAPAVSLGGQDRAVAHGRDAAVLAPSASEGWSFLRLSPEDRVRIPLKDWAGSQR
jgi:hypothetical protein